MPLGTRAFGKIRQVDSTQRYSGYMGSSSMLMWPVGELTGRWSRWRVNAARERPELEQNLPKTAQDTTRAEPLADVQAP
jgi:hypothetical protein